VVEPWKGDSILDTLQLSDDYNLILTARPNGSIPASFRACSYFVFVSEQSQATSS